MPRKKVIKNPQSMSGQQLFTARMSREGQTRFFRRAYTAAMRELQATEPGIASRKLSSRAFRIAAPKFGYKDKDDELNRVWRGLICKVDPQEKRRQEREEMVMEQEELDWEMAFKALPLRETMETLVDDFLWVMNHPAMLRAQKPNEISRPTIEDMLHAPSRAAVQLLSQGMNARTKFMDTMHKLFAKHGGKEWQGDEDETEGGTDNGLDALESFYKGLD